MEVRATPHKKLQSAMEYLMTYGWAILVIAVVLGALYSLGVFNSTNFAPKAPPGSCQVFRPNGPGTTFDLNLMGVCNGELPEYVANNGKNLVYMSTPAPWSNRAFTLTTWVLYEPGFSFCGYANGLVNNTSSYVPRGGIVLACSSSPRPYAEMINASGSNIGVGIPAPLNYNTWYFLALTFNASVSTNNFIFYVDNTQYNTTISQAHSNTFTFTPGSYYFGEPGYQGSVVDAEVANNQVYNTTLSANEIKALYLEGIGGAPIDLQNLVGWWPLNGNANDYSGNGNNGQATGVTYVSNWYSGYTPP
ncbi:MAG: LamG-like jellyroll fold domain-containing protein [Candidatus Micrarchaeaceae archaeon]